MKQNRQFVRVNSDFINKDLSAGAVKVLFLLASIAQAGGSDTAVISNARIAERTKLTNITRIINELYAIGAVTDRIQRFKSNRQKCNAYVLSEAVSAPKNYVLVPISAVELPKSCLRLFMLYCIHASAEGRCLLSLSMIQELIVTVVSPSSFPRKITSKEALSVPGLLDNSTVPFPPFPAKLFPPLPDM